MEGTAADPSLTRPIFALVRLVFRLIRSCVSLSVLQVVLRAMGAIPLPFGHLAEQSSFSG